MFKRLIRLIRQEKVSLFIGAGFSIEANAPSVQKLKETILANIDDLEAKQQHSDDNLSDLSEFYVEEICNGSRNELISLLKDLFSFNPASMKDHETLAKIPHFHYIFTTNYDTLLEDSYPAEDINVIRKDQDCTYIEEHKPINIFKIHGDFQDADSLVITSSDYHDLLNGRKRNPQLWNVVKNEFLKKHILFIGYSLEDDNIIEIIKSISKAVNKNQKDMFLIAPKISEQREGMLKKMKVQYSKAYATEFLETLIKELRKNISDDFKHKKVSAETYTRFCNTHDFIPVITTPAKGDNTIEDIKALPGRTLNSKITFSVGEQYKHFFENIDFERNSVCTPQSPLPHTPLLKIDGSELKQSFFEVNDIVIQKDFVGIFIGPSTTKISLNICIPSRNFIENVKGYTYKLNRNKVVITFDCHIYETKIVFDYSGEGTSKQIKTTFNYQFKDTYTDNNKALLWIDFIDAAFSKEAFTIRSLIKMDFNASGNYFSQESNSFTKYKTFYKNIKEIELLSGQKFKSYNGYTNALYQNSVLVLAYLKQEYIKIESKGGIDFSVRIPSNDEFVKVAKINEKYAIVTGSENLIYEINDRKFSIPYMHNILNTCIISNLHAEDDGYTVIDLHYDDDVYYTQLNDKPINVKYKELTELNHVDIEF
ncbi:SIR2 family protein [uncultured Bacteroides sp.]|uniref:SIR2 family NAD-dependent protein deacylase n=1 Tax=uncultured Bacteroides sp. TaxID=162156 RepID=UPI00262ABDAE|nr:SIR2 family protein [uncultured Bacteroides sp.]